MNNFFSLLCFLLVFISCKDEIVEDNNKFGTVKVDNQISSNKLKIDLENTSIGLGEKIVLKATLDGQNVTDTVDFYLNDEKLSKNELFFTEKGEYNLIAKKTNVENSDNIKILAYKSELTLDLEKSIIKIGEELILKAFIGNHLSENKDVTSETEFYVDGKKISGNKVSFPERGSHNIIAKREKYSYDSQKTLLGVTNNLISYKGKEIGFYNLTFKEDNMIKFDHYGVYGNTFFQFHTKENIKSGDLNVILGKHKLDRLSDDYINYKFFGEIITNDDINFDESYIHVLEHKSNEFNRSKIQIKLKDGSVVKVYFEDRPDFIL